MYQSTGLLLNTCPQLLPNRGRILFAQGFLQSPQQFRIFDCAPANLDDFAFVEQEVWMTRFEIRNRGFDEIEIRATRLVKRKKSRIIKRQPTPPGGGMAGAETRRA